MYCPNCGSPTVNNPNACDQCGWRNPVTSPSISVDPTMRMILPVGRSVYAIIAGYMGLFSLIVLPAPLALVFGILGLREIKADPSKGGKGRAIFGIVMGSLGTLLLVAVIAAAAFG